jgi:hypothetical protein
MNIEFKHLHDINLNQDNEERPFIQLEIFDHISCYDQEESSEEEKEPKRVIEIDL